MDRVAVLLEYAELEAEYIGVWELRNSGPRGH